MNATASIEQQIGAELERLDAAEGHWSGLVTDATDCPPGWVRVYDGYGEGVYAPSQAVFDALRSTPTPEGEPSPEANGLALAWRALNAVPHAEDLATAWSLSRSQGAGH